MRWCLFDGGAKASAQTIALGLAGISEDHFFLDADVWTDSSFRSCDVGVIFGWRRVQRLVMESCRRRGVPTVVVDLGYTHRVSDDNPRDLDATLQMSLGDRSNLIVGFDCPSDRRLAAGISYPGDTRVADGYVLVCGQWPADQTHGFSSEVEIAAWIERDVRPLAGGREIRYRPHPRSIRTGVPIEQDLAGAAVVVTWSSNSGHDALLAGKPVVAWGDNAPYAAIVGKPGQQLLDARLPDQQVWESYFNRLAYSQWSLTEIAAGAAQRFIGGVLNGVLPSVATVQPSDSPAVDPAVAPASAPAEPTAAPNTKPQTEKPAAPTEKPTK